MKINKAVVSKVHAILSLSIVLAFGIMFSIKEGMAGWFFLFVLLATVVELHYERYAKKRWFL